MGRWERRSRRKGGPVKKAMAIALLIALMGAAMAGAEAITFADPVVEAEIRRMLGRPEGPLTAEDLLAVEVFEYGEWDSGQPLIMCLDDLALCKNLKRLALREQREMIVTYTDSMIIYESTGQPVLSLEPLRGLEALEEISLMSMLVRDISPLESILSLRRFKASFTPIKDYAPVLGLPGLTSFVSDAGNKVDLSPLAQKDALEVFELSGMSTPMDYTPLMGHKGLRGVALLMLAQGDLVALTENWPQLEWLKVYRSDLTGSELAAVLEGRQMKLLRLYDCPNLGDISVLAGQHSLEYLELSACGTLDLTPLAGLDSLTFLNLRATHVEDLSPLAACKGLETLFVTGRLVGMSLAEIEALLPGAEVSG